jgi:hypothetical protein
MSPFLRLSQSFILFPLVAVIFSLLKEKREGHLEELYSSSCT